MYGQSQSKPSHRRWVHSLEGNRLAYVALAAFFTLRIFACWYGFDRLPSVSSKDEVIINDPALALSRGEGLIAPSFGGKRISTLYAQHPPLYVLTQAVVFDVFGFSRRIHRFHDHGEEFLILQRRDRQDGRRAVAVGSL